jgi:nucleotide-binding universal stress UspA family protein
MHVSPTDPSAGRDVPASAPHDPRVPVGASKGFDRIVVGVDGSPASTRALLWAAAQAARCDTSLRIVTAWMPPDLGLEAYEYRPPRDEVDTAVLEQARRRAAEAAEQARSVLPADRVSTEVLIGGAAEILIDQSRQADLLVVGSRGLGGFRGLLLGSVSHECASHAACPVVVVRGDPDVPVPAP